MSAKRPLEEDIESSSESVEPPPTKRARYLFIGLPTSRSATDCYIEELEFEDAEMATKTRELEAWEIMVLTHAVAECEEPKPEEIEGCSGELKELLQYDKEKEGIRWDEHNTDGDLGRFDRVISYYMEDH